MISATLWDTLDVYYLLPVPDIGCAERNYKDHITEEQIGPDEVGVATFNPK